MMAYFHYFSTSLSIIIPRITTPKRTLKSETFINLGYLKIQKRILMYTN